ncbi:hypothetical protein EVAR_53504_1 [Eumeta japonica]|uniref:Uncharacterized protein n=1 Tax=Eumeta variegata TaxID=151549 RepID=A0A4C1Y5R5_EUMVA|nr:hypothetical protein EVAR_53504_1 [Eumeta japonica]
MEVFENWLADLDKNKADKGKKSEQRSRARDKERAASDKVSGLRERTPSAGRRGSVAYPSKKLFSGRGRALVRLQCGFKPSSVFDFCPSPGSARRPPSNSDRSRFQFCTKPGQTQSSDKSDEEMPEVEEKKKKESPPPDTVPGLGFKDKETAEQSLQVLEGRDPDYQKLAVKGLIGRAKRVLTSCEESIIPACCGSISRCTAFHSLGISYPLSLSFAPSHRLSPSPGTRDDTKINNIKEAMAIFDRFLDDFETMHLSKQNSSYLPLGVVRRCLETAGERAVGTERQKAFIAAYARVKGEYKRLRTVEEKDGGQTWDIVRNKELKPLKEKYADVKLFDEKNEPTNEHLEMLLWAYSPDAARAKKYIPESSGRESDERKSRSSGGDESNERKRKSSGGDDTDERKRKSGGGEEADERKRKSSGGDEANERKRKSSSGDESGERKRKSSGGEEPSPKKPKE